MAPMTGSITYTNQDGFVFIPGSLQCLLSPRIPINRIVRVLYQVRAALVNEFIDVSIHPANFAQSGRLKNKKDTY
jgi:hypothetical protein